MAMVCWSGCIFACFSLGGHAKFSTRVFGLWHTGYSHRDSGGIKEIIKQKTNNSIIVVSGVQQFVKAMNGVKIKNQNYLSDSLLPERYKQENVVRIIEGWLDEVK